MREHRDAAEPGLAELLGRLSPVDLVLVEGFKRDTHPKIEVYRAVVGKPLLQPGDPAIRAVASDVTLPGCPVPWLHLDDIAGIAAAVQGAAVPVAAWLGRG